MVDSKESDFMRQKHNRKPGPLDPEKTHLSGKNLSETSAHSFSPYRFTPLRIKLSSPAVNRLRFRRSAVTCAGVSGRPTRPVVPAGAACAVGPGKASGACVRSSPASEPARPGMHAGSTSDPDRVRRFSHALPCWGMAKVPVGKHETVETRERVQAHCPSEREQKQKGKIQSKAGSGGEPRPGKDDTRTCLTSSGPMMSTAPPPPPSSALSVLPRFRTLSSSAANVSRSRLRPRTAKTETRRSAAPLVPALTGDEDGTALVAS